MELVDIKDISGNIRFSTPINEGSKRHFLLMQEDYVTLKFSLASPIYFKLGDYIDNELGIFEVVDLYKPTYNTTTGAYDYELRLDAYYWKWKNKKFFYTPETTGREAGWNLTATLDVHLNIFLDNLKYLGYKFRDKDFIWEIDDTVENSAKLVTYDNVNLIDALTQMAEAWGCEWWIENHKICFGRCEYSSPVDFKAGDLTDTENVNVNNMTRSDSQTTYATRIYAFGSTRNIPATYRKDLIFDVKKVNGRDISDTSRPLNIRFFPSVSHAGISPISMNIFEEGEMVGAQEEYKVMTDVFTSSMPASEYHISFNSMLLYFSTRFTSNIENFKAKLSLVYYVGEVEKVLDIQEKAFNDSVSSFTISFSDTDFFLPEKANNCKFLFTFSFSLNHPEKTVVYTIGRNGENNVKLECLSASANTSVTFLSGANSGRTFSAVYNPDLLTGEDANVIRLPEGVTASMGNQYIINNIIKGKIPDNYFSKDDKELTLNGVVQNRLMLPKDVPYIDAYRYSSTGERIDIGDSRYDNPNNVEMPEEEAIEEIVILEDEYPKYIGSVSSITSDEKEEEDNDGNKTGNKYLIYTFKDNGLKNFTKDFVLNGQEPHLIFQTGKLAGLDFVISLKESGNSGTTFEITRNDDYGRYLPDDILYPVVSDTYILYGFDTAFISEQMLPEAEQNLLKKAKEYVKKSMIDPSTYDCEMNADFICNEGNIRTYEVGAKVNLINKAYFPEGRQSRIIGFEWPLDIPYDHPIYTVGETAPYSRIGEIESKLESLTYKGQTYSGSASGGGGTSVYVIGENDNTLPSDKNVFSAKRVLQEIISYSISKTKNDRALGLISFLKGIIVKEGIITDDVTATEVSANILEVFDKLTANNAAIAGNISSLDYAENLLGWLITPEGHIDAKSLRLRDFLEVPELRYNRVSIVSGEEWNAPGGGIIESVDAANKTVHLKLEPGEVSQVEVDDICKGVFNNDTGFQTAYFRITEKIDNASFKYVLRSGYTFNPCKAMHFVAYGNFTNAERQKSCYSTQNYIRFLKGVNNWEITKEMIAMQLGDLSNLKLFGIDMSGHSAYLNRVYMTGTIRQISSDGMTEAPVPVFKGKWKSDTYWYYDEVTHNGSTWICIESTTTQEPSDSSTDWLKTVSEGRPGDNGTSLVFKGESASAPSNPQNGWYYRNTTDKKCYVYQDGAWHLMTEDGKPGADGAGSISAILDDGIQSVACNSSGAVISGLPLTTTFSMYYGTTKLALDSLTVGSITGVTSSANKSTGVVTVSAITAAASDTIRIPVTGKASYKDAQYERTVYLSVNKVKPGSDGENAIIYSLQPSVNVIKKNADGSSEVSKISCRIMKTDGASTVVSSLPAGYSMDYVIDSGTANGYTPGSDVAVSGITTKIQFRLYSETSGVVLVDQQTIVVLKDGSNGKPGDDGVGIKDVDVLFYLSSSATSLIGGSWSTTSPTWVNGKYIWSKTRVIYTNTTTWESDPTCISGGKGENGLGIKSVIEEYYLSTSSSSLIGGSWSTSTPAWVNGKYIWTRTVITYTDSSSTTTDAICVTGAKGDTGIGVKSISGQYYLSTSYSTTTGGSWSTTVPAWKDGKYIWTRSVITYTDNSYTETKPVCVTGGKGPSGNDGKGVKSFGILYYLSTSSSSLVGGSWSTTPPTWQNGKYLWSKTKVTYTDNSTWESDPVCITGSQGQTGLPGAMLRPRGVWAPNTEYYHNDAFIDTVIYNGQNKLCKITHTSTSSFDSTKWEEFSEFVNVATNVLLAQNATIDVLGTSGIFVGNLEKTKGWLMTEGSIKHNQTGVELTADGKISLPESGGMTVGGKTFIEAGKIKTEFINVDTLEVTKLKGATGTFKELQAIDNAGKIQGKISFNTEGSGDNVSSSFNIDFSKTWISGDLYQQGYNSEEGRSWRFYTSDLWCRGEFGHRVMTTIKVFANNDWNFYVHIYGYGSDNNVDRYPQSGQPIDCIVMEGNGNYVLRICDSATFKKVTVVNSSDYPKRVVYNQPSSLTYTIEPWKFVTFVTADIAKTSPPYYVNNLFIK